MKKPKRIIKFLMSDGEAFLCPYCMHHIPGIIPKCPDCNHEISKDIDLRITDGYRNNFTM